MVCALAPEWIEPPLVLLNEGKVGTKGDGVGAGVGVESRKSRSRVPAKTGVPTSRSPSARAKEVRIVVTSYE